MSQVYLTHLKLAVGPSWNLDDHVQNGLLSIRVQGNVVEGGNWRSILLNVDTVLESVWCTDLSDGVLGSHIAVLLYRRGGGVWFRRAREVSSYLFRSLGNFEGIC